MKHNYNANDFDSFESNLLKRERIRNEFVCAEISTAIYTAENLGKKLFVGDQGLAQVIMLQFLMDLLGRKTIPAKTLNSLFDAR
jgi:hypothetical protein